MFDKFLSSMQQKMTMTSVGVTRRQLILDELTIKPRQTIIDVGCGGGQFVEELALRVGAEGLAIGVDPSEAQLSAAKASCEYLKNTKFLSCSAGKIDVDNNNQVAMKYGIRSIPTLLLFNDGEVVDQVIGNVGKESIENMLNKALSYCLFINFHA